MNWRQVKSSNIDAVAFRQGDVKNGGMQGTLSVRFTKGSVYHYLDVPEELYRQLLESHSPGSFLAENIKSVYDYIKDQSEGPL